MARLMVRAWLLLAFWLFLVGALGRTQARAAFPPRPAQEPIRPEDKIAQLLLLTWDGTWPQEEETGLPRLLTRYAVGGFVLQPPRGMLLSREAVQTFLTQAQTLSFKYQREQYGFSRQSPAPLFIAARQYGDGAPWDALAFPYNLPTPMALAATWDPDQAYRVGRFMGMELRAWGINLFLGPTLDPIDPTQLGQPGDLGLRAFGEHPYWVSQMALAYIQGLHEASAGRLAVIAETFPGYGGAARPLEEEIPTLPMSLEQLQSTRLAPFLAASAAPPARQPDGFLVGHIRSQALQGNVKAETPPLSLDPNAQAQLQKTFPQLRTWYEQPGRLWVSADLGAAALKRYYQALDMPYRPAQVAEQALRAGNDVLLLGPGFVEGDADYVATVEAVIQALAQKYQTDPLFARRVDEAYQRVLRLKARLYPRWNLSDVLPDPRLQGMAAVTDLEDVLLEMAQQSATLLAPQNGEGPGPAPGPQDRILILVDQGEPPNCPLCEGQPPPLPAETVMQTFMDIYGPQADGRLHAAQIRVLGHEAVRAWLTNEDPDRAARTQYLMNWSTWVVFLVGHPASPGTQVLLQALEQSPELWRARRVEVFALGPPYVLSASHLPQVAGYYGLYGKGQSALNMTARLLFREASPQGASPVSIPALGYNIAEVLAPDPAQTIPLQWVIPGRGTAAEPRVKRLQVNDAVTVEAGPILDYNGNPVPDGTPLSFLLTGLGGKPLIQRVEGFTREGRGRASFVFDREGVFEIRVESGEARESQVLQVEVALAPTPTPNPTGPAPSPVPSPTASPPPTSGGPPAPMQGAFLLLVGLWLMAALTVGVTARFLDRRPVLWGLLAFDLQLWGSLALALGLRRREVAPLVWVTFLVAGGLFLLLSWRTRLLRPGRRVRPAARSGPEDVPLR